MVKEKLNLVSVSKFDSFVSVSIGITCSAVGRDMQLLQKLKSIRQVSRKKETNMNIYCY